MHITIFLNKLPCLLSLLLTFLLTGCGSGGSSASPASSQSPATYAIGGTVTGLNSGASVTLLDNGSNALTVTSDGIFTLTSTLPSGAAYDIALGPQAGGPPCKITNGIGTMSSAAVTNISIACHASYAYLPSGRNVTQFTVGSNGSLSLLASAALASNLTDYTSSIAINPAGTFLYIGAGFLAGGDPYTPAGLVELCSIGANGGLTLINSDAVSSIPPVLGMAIDPTGQHAYVASSAYQYAPGLSSLIWQFTIGADGNLTFMTNASIATGNDPTAIAIDPTGKFLYITSGIDNTVSQYSIGTDGSLTPMSTATVATSSPSAITIDPAGKHAYVTSNAGNTVSQFLIGTTGSLTPMSTPSITTGSAPTGLTIDPTGQYAYVTNSGNNINVQSSGNGTVSQYTIAANGSLTPMATATVATGVIPKSMAIDPTGQYVYVVNYGTSISQYAIGANGGLIPLATPTVPAQASLILVQ